MITHFLGDQEVAAYSKDLAERLSKLDSGTFPTVWCPIGKSGDKMLREIAKQLSIVDSSRIAKIQTVELSYNKLTRQISLGANCSEADFNLANVLILDSSIHSGSSMLAAVRFVRDRAKSALTYSLTVKRSTSFLPHYFGVVVGDHDRVLFQLDGIPNNRLFSSKYQPMGVFRRIVQEDATRNSDTLDTGVASIDKISLGDLYYDHRANGYDVVLVEDGEKIAAFLKIKATPNKYLHVDVIASDRAYKGKGLGGALMRYAETIGRANCCHHIELWAIEEQVTFYAKFGFEPTNDVIDAGNGEKYGLMKKRLLYHFDAVAED